MKIVRIDLSRLRGEEHFQFMTDVQKLMDETGTGEGALNIQVLYDAFVPKWQQEDKSVEVYIKSQFTDPIAELDSLRDRLYRGLMLIVQGYQLAEEDDLRSAANNIQHVIDNYGDFRTKPYNQETATIANFIQDIHERCIEDIITLHLEDFITNIRKANDNFEETINQRYEEGVGEQTISLLEARKEIDPIYKQIVERIEALYLVNGTEIFLNFINRLNQRIEYYKNTLAIRQGRAAAQKENEEEN